MCNNHRSSLCWKSQSWPRPLTWRLEGGGGLPCPVLPWPCSLHCPSMTKEDLRDPHKTRHLTTADGLKAMSDGPGRAFDWHTLLGAYGLTGRQLQEINVTNPAFLAEVARWVGGPRVDLDMLKAHADFHVLVGMAGCLHRAMQDEAFGMQKLLTGAKAQLPYWKRAVQLVSEGLWEPVGKLYCDRYWVPPPPPKELFHCSNRPLWAGKY